MLVQLVSISTSSQTVTMLGWWRMFWLDKRLAWDPKDPENKGIERLVVDSDKIWRPDEMIYEAISESDVQVAATVFSDGSVFISVPKYQTIGCSMDLTNFPFDTQECEFLLGSRSYTYDLVDFIPRVFDDSGNGMLATGTASGLEQFEPDQDGRVMNVSAVGLDFPFKKNLEWTLLKIRTTPFLEKYSCCKEPFALIEYRLFLRRVPLTYMTSIIIPMFVIILISFLSYLMTPVSGARAGEMKRVCATRALGRPERAFLSLHAGRTCLSAKIACGNLESCVGAGMR